MAKDTRKPDDGGSDSGVGVVTKTKTVTKRPNLYRVLMLNDDYTPMEFVVHVVMRFFQKSQDEAEATFYGALEKAHPDWRALNTTQAFLGFLNEYIPSMGMTRQDIVDNAGNVGNPEPIINQLTEFKAHTATGSSMTGQVVPADGGGSPPPADSTKRMIPESEIKTFYKDASTRIAKDPSPETAKEVKRLDQEYDDAMREGRILVGQ